VSCLIERESLGQCERPALFESASDHGGAGARGCTGQTERMFELESAHLYRQVDVVDWREEQRQTGHFGYSNTG